MSLKKQSVPQFHISAVSVYVDQESQPDKRYYFFAYKITIKNVGHSPAQLMSRHWIITDGLGHQEEVRGPGVVGLQPKIQPNQSFEYESACPLPTNSGSMKGQYYFVDDQGENFTVEIPEFYLYAPHAIH
ncbi:MAG: Co2+/Mg2+ efflux protein ApaG [Pseudobdellovibrio sp.]